jgi:hypothetical protein
MFQSLSQYYGRHKKEEDTVPTVAELKPLVGKSKHMGSKLSSR